jgi:hypothetical protein
VHSGRRCAAICGRPRGPLRHFVSIHSRTASFQTLGSFRSPPSRCQVSRAATYGSGAGLRWKCQWRIDKGKAALQATAPPQSEVRLPQGLRFTDVRRSAIGDFTLARRGPRASKSHGRLELCPPACLLFSLRLPSAADLLCANLRCLLDGVSRPKRSCVCALRRHRGCGANGIGAGNFSVMQGLPPGPATLCAGSRIRALRGAHEGGHSRA